MDVVDQLRAAEADQTIEWLTLLEIEAERMQLQLEHLARIDQLDAQWRRQKTKWTIARAAVDELAKMMDKEFLG